MLLRCEPHCITCFFRPDLRTTHNSIKHTKSVRRGELNSPYAFPILKHYRDHAAHGEGVTRPLGYQTVIGSRYNDLSRVEHAPTRHPAVLERHARLLACAWQPFKKITHSHRGTGNHVGKEKSKVLWAMQQILLEALSWRELREDSTIQPRCFLVSWWKQTSSLEAQCYNHSALKATKLVKMNCLEHLPTAESCLLLPLCPTALQAHGQRWNRASAHNYMCIHAGPTRRVHPITRASTLAQIRT